jgi:hypothetical protein
MRLLPAAAALLLAACAMEPEPQAEVARSARLHATVKSVDLATRAVTLHADDGEVYAFTAGPEVRRLDEIRPGDGVLVEYAEAVAARMAAPGEEGRVGVGAVGRAPETDAPGAFAAASRDVVVEVVSYDPETGVGVVRNPEGLLITVLVDPEMRPFAAARRPGERVVVTISEALVISLEPAG